jgi:hypothetical protein
VDYAAADDYLPIDPAAVYEDAGSDHHLGETSPARESGTDIGGQLPVAIFPEVDFSLDLEGNPRAQGSGWDMGAYEYSEQGTGSEDAGGSGSGGCFISGISLSE